MREWTKLPWESVEEARVRWLKYWEAVLRKARRERKLWLPATTERKNPTAEALVADCDAKIVLAKTELKKLKEME